MNQQSTGSFCNALGTDNEILIPTTFIRHRRQLRAVLLDDEPWFSATDLGRLIGRPLDERLHNSLDPDQLRSCWIKDSNGQYEKSLLVNESGAYAALIFYYLPENRCIRHWLNRQVVPTLRSEERPALRPRERQLNWSDQCLGVLEWHGRLWVPFEELPKVARLETPQA